MTQDGLLVLQALFSIIWRFFTSWYIPCTHTTPAMFFLFLGVAAISLRFVQRVTMTYYSHGDRPISDESGKH